MNSLRKIREEERLVLKFLLEKLGKNTEVVNNIELVDNYEGGIMGSIGLGTPDAIYAGDLIRVEYVDSDGTDVVITLTEDTENQLLDLDFWKIDFSKLQEYPTPEKIIIKSPQAHDGQF